MATLGCRTVKEKPDDQDLAGSYHQVKKGDTLKKLAKTYRLSEEEIIETNGIEDERALKIGQRLFMPDPDPIGHKIAQIKKGEDKKSVADRSGSAKPTGKPRIFSFPVPQGRIIYRFSTKKERPYDGIGIKAPLGTEIVAAQDGRVIFVGDDGTKFGLVVIIEHQEPYITVYAHLRSAKVKIGQLIKEGRPLGDVGRSGGVLIPHLHFQIRVHRHPKNPERYLKEITQAH